MNDRIFHTIYGAKKLLSHHADRFIHKNDENKILMENNCLLFICRTEKELFKCRNAKYSHVLSETDHDREIVSHIDQAVAEDDRIHLGNQTETSAKKKRGCKSRIPFQKKRTNTLISR